MIIYKKCKEVIINSLRKYHNVKDKEIKAIENNDFMLVRNDLIVGINSFTIPYRYYDFFYPVK